MNVKKTEKLLRYLLNEPCNDNGEIWFPLNKYDEIVNIGIEKELIVDYFNYLQNQNLIKVTFKGHPQITSPCSIRITPIGYGYFKNKQQKIVISVKEWISIGISIGALIISIIALCK